MDHVRIVLVRFFAELVSLFGREGALLLIALAVLVFLSVVVFALAAGYVLLKFGEATLEQTHRFISHIANVFKYHPQNASPAIKVELHLERLLGVVVLLCVVLIAGHALIPWVSEKAEIDLGIAIVCSIVVFGFLGYQSIRIENHLPARRTTTPRR